MKSKIITSLICLIFATALAQGAAPAAVPAVAPAMINLCDFGPVDTVKSASATYEKAVKKIIEKGGGLLIISSETHRDFIPDSFTQNVSPELDYGSLTNTKVVTVLDMRGGKMRFILPSLGFRLPESPHGYSTVFLNRQIKQDNINLNGDNTVLRIENDLIHGSCSYAHQIRYSVALPDKNMQRIYLKTIKGLCVGQILSVKCGTPGTDWSSKSTPAGSVLIRVEKLGWDAKENASYADARKIQEDKPWGPIISFAHNKSTVSALYIKDTSRCDGELPGSVMLDKYIYGQGDNWGMGIYYRYMGNIMSTGGDERGVGINIDTWHLLDSFTGKVEKWNPETGELVYTVDSHQANSLGTSRPLINLNPDKWITQGQVVINRAAVDGKISGQSDNPKTYVRGVGTSWSKDIIGRCIAIDTAEEYAGAEKDNFWNEALRGRKVRRWWWITHYEKTPDGEDRLWVERTSWYAYDRATPSLMNPDNYEKPLPYIIAPGAFVTDVRDGVLRERKDTRDGQSVMPGPTDKRIIRLAPSSTTKTRWDFEPGDMIEQAVGSDPACPIGVKVRHREAMPSLIPYASFWSQNNGAYPVDAGLMIAGGDRPGKMQIEDQSNYIRGMDIETSCDYGIFINGRMKKAAIFFKDKTYQPQPLIWETKHGETKLFADPDTGALRVNGAPLAVSGESLAEVGGISATTTPARNLRGKNVPVTLDAKSITIIFPVPESDADYAVFVEQTWLTNRAIAEKTQKGFTVEFEEAAPEKAKLDWMIVR